MGKEDELLMDEDSIETKGTKGKKSKRASPAESQNAKQSMSNTKKGTSMMFGGKQSKQQAHVLAQRIEKIENYLQDRFNWLNIKKEKEESPLRKKIQEKKISKFIAETKKEPRYKYVVDMKSPVQDPG